MSNIVKNLQYIKYGKLTVIKDSGKRTKAGSVIWECKCDCGTLCEVDASNIGKGTKSCGCYRKSYKRKNALEKNEASLNGLYYDYIRNAKKRKKDFQLTKEQFKELTSQNCHYCNKVPSKIYYKEGCNGEYIYNGIDRKDNSKGYIIENSLPCCYACNTIKGEHLTYEEAKVAIQAVLEYRSRQNG